MAFLRLVLSAVVGAMLAVSLFAAMGMATSPDRVRADTLAAYPGLDWPPPGSVEAEDVKTLWHGVTRPAFRPVQMPSLDWDEPVSNPGFETETVIDPAHLKPELVVMSRTLSTTEAVHERRWWRALFHRLGK